MNINGVGDIVVAKTLAVINPDLFMMWDNPILLAYYEEYPQNRTFEEVYVAFLRKMQGSAISIVNDAGINHNIKCPVKYLSEELGLKPPFTLAKFIDEYNLVHTR